MKEGNVVYKCNNDAFLSYKEQNHVTGKWLELRLNEINYIQNYHSLTHMWNLDVKQAMRHCCE